MHHLLLRLSIFYAFIIVILFSSSICTAYKRPYKSAFISNKISIHPVAISHRSRVLCNNSPTNNDEEEEDDDDTISTPSSLLLDQILKLEKPPEEEDPDGTPLFDTNNKRPTLFGLEPNYIDNDDPSSEYAGIDPLDNGLQFTGKSALVLFYHVHVCVINQGVSVPRVGRFV